MGLMNWLDKNKKFTVMDIALDEVSMIAFALLIAKYWTVVTSLAWYWYVAIGVIAIIKPVMALFKK